MILFVLTLIRVCQADIVEGFDPGSGQYLDISESARTSADTGYAWSGYYGGALWNMCLYDAKSLPINDGILDMSGNNAPNGFDNLNAWTVFNGAYVSQLSAVTFEWLTDGASGNLLAEAIIQDASGNWFVSDDTVVDTAGTTQTINTTTTAWRQLNSAPVFNTALDIGGVGTPDLSMVTGGGFHTIGTGQAVSLTRLNTLTFVGTTQQSQEVDPNNPPVSMRVTVDKSGEVRTFNLDKYSVRGSDFEVVLLDPNGIGQTTIDPGPVRSYRGWCEEEADSYVEAGLLPNGDLRYHVFKGIAAEDWWDIPPSEYDEAADPDENFTDIGGTPVDPSGTKLAGASWTDPAVALAALWETYGAGYGDLWTTTYQADVGFDLLVEYVDQFDYSDWATYGRKAENTISHYNGLYIRDALFEHKLGKVVIRQSQAGLDYTNPQWGIEWSNINWYWSTRTDEYPPLSPDVNHHFIGMVGAVGGGVAHGCEYSDLGWAARSLNAWSADGTYWHIARHEMGHNQGAGDCVGGCPGPDGSSVMSGNSIPESFFSTLEVDSFMWCRSNRTSYLRELGNYSYPVPPYAKYDTPEERTCVDEGAFIDVLGNDYDANGDQVAIASFDTVTTLGGTVAFSAGTGPDGRDELVYSSPSVTGLDTFIYSITDSTGRVGHGNVKITVDHELVVTSASDITFSGSTEGPFIPGDTDLLTLSNISSASLDWTASKTASWLDLSSTSGTISSGNSTDVTVTMNTDANSLEPGEYTDTITITDTTNSHVEYRSVILTVIPRQLQGCWKMDEGTGSTAGDSTTNNNDGTITGASWTTGQFNGALNFDGVDDYVTVTIDVSETDYAVSLWFRTTASTGGLYSVSGNGHDRQIFLTGDGNLHARLWSEETITTTGLDVSDGNWHHVVHTYGGYVGGQKLYVDGVLKASGTKTSSDFYTQTIVYIGYALWGEYFDGDIDDVRLYNYALDTAEIASLYDGGKSDAPDPVDGAQLVSPDQDLSWIAGSAAINNDVYLGTSYSAVAAADTGSDEYKGRQSATTYNPSLADNTDYYWRIDVVTDSDVITGDVWSFTTATTLVENLLGYWNLDETSGVTADDGSNYSNDGTVTNTTFDAGSVTGKLDNALQFDGDDDHISIPDDPSLNPTDDISVSAWIKADTWLPLGSIVSKDYWGSGHCGYVLRCKSDGRVTFALADGSNTWGPTGALYMSTGTWYHVVGTYDGSTVKVYINGEKEGEVSRSSSIPVSSYPVSIGRGTYDTTRIFDGAIDDVGIWDRALTTDEIDYLYNSGTGNPIIMEFFGNLPGDFEPDGDVDLVDLSYLTQRWLLTGCASPDWCQGADLDHLGGTVNLADFAIFAENWLK